MSLESILKNLIEAINANTEAITGCTKGKDGIGRWSNANTEAITGGLKTTPAGPPVVAPPVVAPPVVAPPVVAPPVVAPPAGPPAGPPVVAPAGELSMIVKGTYESYKTAGWTDEQMINSNIAKKPVATVLTLEELNAIMITEFNRIGDRKPIDAVLKDLGVNGISDLPADKYETLISKVKALVV